MLDGVTRRKIRLPESGVEIALLDWGGQGPPALLHHANGFCAALWAPVAELLRSQFRIIALDARGHGDSPRPDERDAFSWEALASDLIEVGKLLLQELEVERFALGLGHSFGGTLTLAAAARADLYQRIVLVDPVLYPAGTPKESRRGGELAVRARKRRAVWGSRAEAREFFLSKPLFADWRPEAVEIYLAEGLRDRADGQVELKCDPEVEALIFEGPPDLDNEASGSRLRVPALLIWASRGNFPLAMFQGIVGRMRAGTLEEMDVGHLAPMEQPDRVAEAVLRFCTTSEASEAFPSSA